MRERARSCLALSAGSAVVLWLMLSCSDPAGDATAVRWAGAAILLGQGAVSSSMQRWRSATSGSHAAWESNAPNADRVSAVVLHVDCDAGSDSLGDGSSTRPWLTPRRARDAVRALQPVQRPVDIFVRGHCYPRRHDGAVDFTQSLLELYPLDSGSPVAPIAYRSYPGEARARLLSGLPVPPTAWRRSQWPHIWSLNLTEMGVDKSFLGGFRRPDGTGLGECNVHKMELFLDGRAMTLARYPNLALANGSRTPAHDRWVRIDEVLDEQEDFITQDLRVLRWAAEPEGWLHGYWGFDWADSHIPIKEVVPAKPRVNASTPRARIAVDSKVLYGFKAGAKFYGVNLRCELDAPGEYYVDRSQGELLFWPPVNAAQTADSLSGAVLSLGDFGVVMGLPPAELSVLLDRTNVVQGPEHGPGEERGQGFERFVRFQETAIELLRAAAAKQGRPGRHETGGASGGGGEVAHVSLRGLDVMYQRRSAIVVVGGRHVSLEGVDVANTGQMGVVLDGSALTALAVNVSNAGCGGVALSGGDYATLTPSRNRLVRCRVSNYARIRRAYTPGVRWLGVGHSVSESHVFDAPHSGILGFGNDGVFENNVLRDLAYEATDTGAWYSGRSWVRRGHVIRGNLFERIINTDVMSLGYACVMGIYLDDMLAGVTIVNNTMRDVQVGIHVGGSRDVSILSNVFIAARDACVRIEPIGLTWRADACAFWGNMSTAGILPQQLHAANYLEPPYATAYPTLGAILHRKPCAPVDIQIVNNEYDACGTVSLFGPGWIDTPAVVVKEELNTVAINRNVSSMSRR